MFPVPFPKAIYSCQGKVTKVWCSHFKCHSGVQYGVQKACRMLVHMEMDSESHEDQRINMGEI